MRVINKFMKKPILNLEDVEVLSKIEMKKVDGGRRCSLNESIDSVVLYSPGTGAGELVPVAVTCTWTYIDKLLSIGVGSNYSVKDGC